MSLIKQKSQLPKDAVILTEAEATTYIWEVVNNWESLYETYVKFEVNHNCTLKYFHSIKLIRTEFITSQ